MKRIYIYILALLGLGLTSCNEWDAVDINQGNNPQYTQTLTLQQFYDTYRTELGVYPVRPNSGTEGLYSVDTIGGVEDVVISGRIVSTDEGGNVYKQLVIQDLTDPNYGLKISVDASGISALYPMGSVLNIRVNDMVLGNYAGSPQLGVLYYNESLDNTSKRGYEPGRMPYSHFYQNAEIVGLPELSKIVVDTVTIAELVANVADYKWQSRIICIKNAYFTQQTINTYGDLEALSEELKIFAPQNDIGYPESRIISDGTGTTTIATSIYAKFANTRIPEKDYVGNVIAIVGYYRDKSQYDGKAQLTLRTLDDLDLYNAAGEKWVAE